MLKVTCLNLRLRFDVLMKFLTDKSMEVDSMSEYYGHGITCEKNENGFFKLNCILSLCNNCEVKPMFTDSDFTIPDVVRFHQFVLDKYSYVNKKGETKEGKRTVRKEFEETFQDFKSGFDSKRAMYLLHRYEIKNDQYITDLRLYLKKNLDTFSMWTIQRT